MSQIPSRSTQVHAPSVIPIITWCLSAGGLTACALLIPAIGTLAPEYAGGAGPFRLLLDLVLFVCFFVLPLWRRGKGEATSHGLVVVMCTGIVGLIVFSRLAGLSAESLGRAIGFVTLASLASDLWASALAARRGVYFSVAAALCFGVPIIQFFLPELLGIRAEWLTFVSPFSAWRSALTLWSTWLFMGLLAVFGGLLAVLPARRGKRCPCA